MTWPEVGEEVGATMSSQDESREGIDVLSEVRSEVWGRIRGERDRQDRKWGWLGTPGSIMPEGDLNERLAVLAEEFGEVAKVVNGIRHAEEGGTREHLHEELVQVAAVALAWIEADLEYDTSYTWGNVPTGFIVAGSGRIVRKENEGRVVYVTFDRDGLPGGIPFDAPAWKPDCNMWTAGRDPNEPVPIYLNSKTGKLIYAKGVREPRLFR